MHFIPTVLFTFLAAGTVLGAPVTVQLNRRVTLDPAATAEAQQRDDTATRAVTAAEIRTSDGQCLFVDPESGDFRENLIPIQTAACNGSAAQQWDVLTAGKHNDQPGFALVVSTLTNGCLNFDPRRAAGNQVILFSCGGRADGEGLVTDSQLFPFTSASSPLALTPKNSNNAVCLTVKNGLLDQEACDATKPAANELFTIGSGSGAAPAPATSEPAPASSAAASSTAVNTETAAPAPTPSPAGSAPISLPSTTLDQAAVAEAQQRDDTATRAFTGAQLKSSDGQCLTVDPNSGDFRENLIPITVQACSGADAQKWDVITSGKHNNVAGSALIVSALTQGCMNFDPRRKAGNQVLLFSCGGRADGGGEVTNSQLFPFSGDATLALTPENQAGTCFVNNGGFLDVASCDTANPAADQLFTFVQ